MRRSLPDGSRGDALRVPLTRTTRAQSTRGDRRTRWLGAVLGLVCGSAAAQVGPVVYVDASATGAGDGSSWANAHVDLTDGLVASSAFGEAEVWVAAGVYRPGGASLERDASFVVPPGVRLYGGFFGDEAQSAASIPALYETVLCGDLAGNDDAGIFDDNSEHVLVVDEAFGIQSFVEGITIRNGRSLDVDEGGGGLLVRAGGVSLENVRFEGNTAVDGGGAYIAFDASVGFKRCVFVDNRATRSGGAVAAADGSFPTLVGSRLHGNIAKQDGGALASLGVGGFAVLNSIFTGNRAIDGSGGAVSSGAGEFVMHGSTVTDNEAGGGADAIAFGSELFQLTGSILWGPVGGDRLLDNLRGGLLLADTNVIRGWLTLPYPIGTTFDTDPLFVDVPGADGIVGTEDDDVRLRVESPLIDRSDLGPGTVFDVNKRSRLLDGLLGGSPRVDIGAHEYTNISVLAPERATPGKKCVIEIRASADLNVTMLASPATGFLLDQTFGAMLLDLPSLLLFEELGTKRTVVFDLPREIPPMTVYLQFLALQAGSGAGNGSVVVEIAIE